MNRKTFTLRLTAVMLTAVFGFSLAACGGNKPQESLEASDASAAISSITTTTEATTTLTEYTGNGSKHACVANDHPEEYESTVKAFLGSLE